MSDSTQHARPGSLWNKRRLKPRVIKLCAYQHKTIPSSVRLLFRKLRNDRLQVLSRETRRDHYNYNQFSHQTHVRANNLFNKALKPTTSISRTTWIKLKTAPNLPLSRLSEFPHHNPWSDGLRFWESTEFEELNTGLLFSAKGQHVLCLHHLCIPGRSNWNPGQRLLLVTRTWHAINKPEGGRLGQTHANTKFVNEFTDIFEVKTLVLSCKQVAEAG